jgi:hypothetical protein
MVDLSRPFIIEPTKETPHVVLDTGANRFEVSGRSFPLNAKGFYASVLEWLDAYVENPNQSTDFVFRLEYFNTPSSKSISDILKRMKAIQDGGKEVKIIWYYEEDDIDILDLGHVFSRTVGMPFDFREYND